MPVKPALNLVQLLLKNFVLKVMDMSTGRISTSAPLIPACVSTVDAKIVLEAIPVAAIKDTLSTRTASSAMVSNIHILNLII